MAMALACMAWVDLAATASASQAAGAGWTRPGDDDPARRTVQLQLRDALASEL
jgi:hypothetical protein